MLTAYQTQLQALIQAPNSPTPLVPTATQTVYINTARNQVAADAECVRDTATLALNSGTQTYDFAAILPPAGKGYLSVIVVRSGLLNGNNLEFRPWEWFQADYLGRTTTGVPTLVSQQRQGGDGTLSFYPIPNGTLQVNLDVVMLPIPLVDDTTIDAIPQLWSDAVPFYAAWLAMQSLQRQADAESMLRRYHMLAMRGRQLATPSELPDNLPGGVGTALGASKTILSAPSQQR